ncbi:hypothetical protein ACLOJK_016455 [Asimina triloba]
MGRLNSHKTADHGRRPFTNFSEHINRVEQSEITIGSVTRDKASLLEQVVQHVKELKRRHAADMASSADGGTGWELLPTETDEVTLDLDHRSSLIKASVCCDDRPGLLSDLNGALRSLRLRPVRAEIATLGGRTKSVFLIERIGGSGGDECDEEYQRLAIHRAFKAVLDQPGLALPPAASPSSLSPSSSSSTSSAALLLLGNKRPRLARTQPLLEESQPSIDRLIGAVPSLT